MLQTIKCLLIQPNPESALNEEAGKLLLEHYDDYEARARLMTEIHAIPSSEKYSKEEDRPSTSGLNRLSDSTNNSQDGAPATKKLAADKLNERKKRDKKRGLKRL